MRNERRKVKLFFNSGLNYTLLGHCGHLHTWTPEIDSKNIPEYFDCHLCKTNNPENYLSIFFPINDDNYEKYFRKFDSLKNLFFDKSKKIEFTLSDIVRYNRETINDQKKYNSFYKLQIQFNTLLYDVLLSAEILKEGYTIALKQNQIILEERLKSFPNMQTFNGIFNSLEINQFYSNHCYENFEFLPFAHRLSINIKSHLLWLRAFQDSCAKIINLSFGNTPGNYTSMNDILKKKNTETYKIIESQIKNYIDWFSKMKSLRDKSKTGLNFNTIGIKGNQITISEGSSGFEIDLEFFCECFEYSEKISQLAFELLNEYKSKLIKV
ncbi:hypothetical protein AB3N58_10260 [Leptospira sp. WS60.C2]